MGNIAQSDNATKQVRVSTETWESAAHEAINRRSNVIGVLNAAWKAFMSLSEGEREAAVRAGEKQPA